MKLHPPFHAPAPVPDLCWWNASFMSACSPCCSASATDVLCVLGLPKALHNATDDITSAFPRRRAVAGGHPQRHRKNHRRNHSAGRATADSPGEDRHHYSFKAGELHRQLASSRSSELVLPTVKASQMVKETRGSVTAWRWELELASRRKERICRCCSRSWRRAKTMP